MSSNTDAAQAYTRMHPVQYDADESRRGYSVPPADVEYEGQTSIMRLPVRENPVSMSKDYGDPDFITFLSGSIELKFEHSMSSWIYTDRQQAQSILPFLLLGPFSFACDVGRVQEAGITMLVAVRSKSVASKHPKFMDPARLSSSETLQTATVDVDSAYDLIRAHKTIVKLMNDHLQEACNGRSVQHAEDIPARILIFCETGNERSPVLVAAYLMAVCGLDSTQAVQAVQARRFGIGIQPEMQCMLQDLDVLFAAQRQVHDTITQSSASSKRNIDDVYDAVEDMEVEQHNDLKHPMRAGIAPFKDIF